LTVVYLVNQSSVLNYFLTIYLFFYSSLLEF